MLAGAVRERAVIPGAAGSVSPCRSDAMLDQPLVIFSKSAVTFSLLFKKKPFWVWIWAAYKVIHLLHQCYFLSLWAGRLFQKAFFHSQLSIWSVSCDAKTQSTDLKQSWEAPFNARSSHCCHDDEAFQKHVHATPVKNMSLAFINSGGKKTGLWSEHKE